MEEAVEAVHADVDGAVRFDVTFRLYVNEDGVDCVSYYPQTGGAGAFLRQFLSDPDGGYPFPEAPDHAWFRAAGLTLGPRDDEPGKPPARVLP